MNNKLLTFLLFSMLLGQSAFAQRRLSSSVQPYAENWTYPMVQAFHRAGFEMPTMAAAPVVANPDAASLNPLQLDSTKTFIEYGLNMPGDSTPQFRSTYIYPFPNVKIETNYQYGAGTWEPLNRATLISDDQQRLVEVIAEAFDPETQTFKHDSYLEIYPHGDSEVLTDSFFSYVWDSTILGWHVILANRHTYDTQDRLLETVNSIDYFGDPVIFKEVYSYDANGDNHLIEEFAILGNDVLPSSRTDIQYVDHRPIEVLVSGSDGVSFFPQHRANTSYTLFGAIRKELNFEWNDSTQLWYLYQTIEYLYSANQRLFGKETIHYPPNAWDVRERIYYGYADDENLYLEIRNHWDHDVFDWLLDSKKYYYYAGLVSVGRDPVMAQPLVISPNPTVDYARLQLVLPAIVQIYTAAGELVNNIEWQPGQVLNLHSLPSGLYYIRAQAANEQYVGRIVKE
jgi:hypothetical protein